MLSARELREVPSLLGGELAAEVAGQLPEHTPPAPWHSNVCLAAWAFRSTPASARTVPAPLTPGLGLGVAAFIDYLDGAVGPYREILASPRCVRRPGHRGLLGSVPFIAVDSIASIHGGRTNWALPKLAAEFSGRPTADPELSVDGESWQVGAQVRPLGPWLRFRAAGWAAQPWPDGGARRFQSRFRGRMRLARLEVDVSGADALRTVLPAGRHLGVLIRGEVDVGAPEAP